MCGFYTIALSKIPRKRARSECTSGVSQIQLEFECRLNHVLFFGQKGLTILQKDVIIDNNFGIDGELELKLSIRRK